MKIDFVKVGKVIVKGIMTAGGVAAGISQMAALTDTLTGYSKKQANENLDKLIDAKLNERLAAPVNVEPQQEVETQ